MRTALNVFLVCIHLAGALLMGVLAVKATTDAVFIVSLPAVVLGMAHVVSAFRTIDALDGSE